MGRWYMVHAVSDCEFCVDAVKLLNQTGFEYVLALYDRSPAVLNNLKNVWNHNTTPIIIEYDVTGKSSLVGGFTDLVEYFADQGYIEVTKKITEDQKPEE